MNDFNYEILKNIGLIAVTPGGWSKELNLISYNGAVPKYDIRDWSIGVNGETKMSKGITLREEELKRLHNLLIDMYGKEKVEVNND